jgi:DNA-binding NtrC family response regulator
VKLLRVLDGMPYYRLGGTRKIQVDVRIVAATNADLERAASEGRFRGDLFHRLSQVVLRVPPLRERVEDIAPLADHFLAGYGAEPKLTREALDVLERYWWPGNVRELRNVLTRAALLADGAPIGPEHLGLPVEPRGVPAPVVLHRLDSLEREAILRALRSTGGHRERAAALLGISRRTLSRRLKLYRALEEADRRDAVRIAGGAHHNGSHDNERELSGKTA